MIVYKKIYILTAVNEFNIKLCIAFSSAAKSTVVEYYNSRFRYFDDSFIKFSKFNLIMIINK